MMYKHEPVQETLRDQLEAIDRRIARMQALNTNQGDALALRLIQHAKVERRQIQAQLAASERKPA
jgi:hypothetical protein